MKQVAISSQLWTTNYLLYNPPVAGEKVGGISNMAPSTNVAYRESKRFKLRDITVEPAVFLYMFSINVGFPTIQAFIYHKVCIQKYNDSFCQQLKNATFQHEHPADNDYVQTKTSHWILLGNIALTLPACFVVLLFLGTFGDQVGRKLPVVLPIFGALIHSVSNLVNALYPEAPLYLLLIGPLANSFCGGITAFFMATFSYISHIALPESKTMRIGITEAMVCLAGTVGVFISGVLLDHTSFIAVFGFNIGLVCLALVYVLIWLENIKPVQSQSARSGGACGVCRWLLDSAKEMVGFLKTKREAGVRLAIFLIIISLDLSLLCVIGEVDILLLFVRLEPLAWSQTLFGYFKGFDNLLRGLVLIVTLPLLKRKLHVSDSYIVMGGIISKIIGFICLGFSTKTWMVFLSGVLGMAQGLTPAGLRSLVSSQVEQNEQGRMFSFIAASESIVVMLASLLFNTVYPATLHILPGFSFLLAAVISLLAFFIVLYMHKAGFAKHQPSGPAYSEVTNEDEEPLDLDTGNIQLEDGPHIGAMDLSG